MFLSYKYWSRYNFIIIPALLFLSLILLLKSSYYKADLSVYITIDFVLTIPLLYFLLIRKRAIPKITVLSVTVVSTLIAAFLIPESDQYLLKYVKNIMIPVVEVGVLGFVFYKARLLFKSFKSSNESTDFFATIQIASEELFPKRIAHFLATEITVFYYLFFSWKSTKTTKNSFSYHKEGTYNSVLLGILLVMLIETFVLHFFIVKWSEITAWILTILSCYTLLQFLALFIAISKRPIEINEERNELIVRFGFAGLATIPLSTIEKVTFSSKEIEDETIHYFSFLGKLAGHNTILYFKEEVEYETIYGIKKNTNALAFIVDDKKAFLETIQKIKNS